MNCSECSEDMTQGVLWLGVLSCAAKVMFSPLRGVSWVRRRLAGTIFYNEPHDGEVEVLSRGWTDTIFERSCFFCHACGILVCRIDSPTHSVPSDASTAQLNKQDVSL